MDEESYKASLIDKPMEELTAEIQKLADQIDMLFTLQNSLDDVDLTEGGGSPEAQSQYKECVTKQHLITAEINKRHMLEELK